MWSLFAHIVCRADIGLGDGFGASDCFKNLSSAARFFWEIVLARNTVSGNCSERLLGGRRLVAETVSAREIVLRKCFRKRGCFVKLLLRARLFMEIVRGNVWRVMTVCGNCFGACDCCGRLCRAARLSLEIVFALGIVSGDCSSRLFGVWRLFAEIVSAREIVLGDCFGPRDCLGYCFREGDCLWRLFGNLFGSRRLFAEIASSHKQTVAGDCFGRKIVLGHCFHRLHSRASMFRDCLKRLLASINSGRLLVEIVL